MDGNVDAAVEGGVVAESDVTGAEGFLVLERRPVEPGPVVGSDTQLRYCERRVAVLAKRLFVE